MHRIHKRAEKETGVAALSTLRAGETGVVKELHGGRWIVSRLGALGFTLDADVEMVQNYGHDELSRFWAPGESECETWPPWFAERGFTCEVVDTVWRFCTLDEALAVLEFLWGEPARAYVLESGNLEFGYKIAIYHLRMPEYTPSAGQDVTVK